MKRISQTSEIAADCGVACVAMVTGTSYSEAMEKLCHVEQDGVFYTRHKDIAAALSGLGFSGKQKRFKRFRDIRCKAIVATNKRQDGYWHWVAFDGETDTPYVYDPKPHKKEKIVDFRGLNGFGNYIQVSSARQGV